MKATLLTVLSCLILGLSGTAFAWSDYNNDEFGGSGGGCGSGGCGGGSCNPYVSSCQCTDPLCGTVDNNCLSTGYCCEAFGNVGAR